MSFSMENVFCKVPRKRSSLMEKKASSRSQTQRVPLSEQLMYLQNHLAEFEASMMERAEEIESKERDIAKLEASMESKERELGERVVKVESREELVSKSTEEMEVKLKKLNEEATLWDETRKVITKMVGEKGKDLPGFREMLELIERELEGFEKMSLERKDFEKQCKALELRERELDERFEKLKSKEGEVDAGFKKLELREKVLKKRNVKKMEGKWNDLELQQRRIKEAWEAVELERKEMKSKVEQTCMGVELVEKALDDTFHEIGLKEEELREGVRDLESREKRLVEDGKRVELEKIGICERERVLELEKKRIDESCKTLELKMKQAEELSMEIGRKNSQAMKLREQQMNERLAMLEMEKAKRVDELRKEMELREQQCKLCDERCQALESKEKEMKEKCRILESNEKEMKEQYQLMESKRKRLKVEIHYQETKCQIYRLCQAMDGKRLQIFLNERVSEHKSLSRGLGKAFKMWSFTPKLVLDAICSFFPPYLNRSKPDSGAYEANVVRSSCILLLEVFMNTKLRVSESVKSLAFDLAKEWKQDMIDEGETDVVVLGFLLLIAAYELVSNFDRSYLRRLYEIVAQHRLAPVLYSRLGLSKSKNVSSSSPHVKNGNPRSDSSLLTKSEAVSSASQGKEAQAKSGKLKSAAPRGTSTGVPSTVEGTKNPGKFPTVKNREVSDSAAELVSDAEVCSKDGKRRSASSTSPKQEKRPKIDAKQPAVPPHSTGSTAPAGSVTHPLQPHQSDPQDAKTRISNSNLPRNQVNQPAAGSNQTPTHHFPVHPVTPHGSLSNSQDEKMESAAVVSRPTRGTWPRVGSVNHHISSPTTPSAAPSHPESSMYSVWPYQSQRQSHHFGASGHSKNRNSYRYDYHSRVWR